MLIPRRSVLGVASAAAAGLCRPYVARAATPRVLRIADTTATQEMAVYALPDFIGPDYSITQFNFGAAGTTMLAAMMNRMCDTMATANSYLVSARSEGANLVTVCGAGGKGHAVVCREGHGIKTLDDMRGQKIVTKTLTSSHVMLQVLLRGLGIDPVKEIQVLDCGQPAGFPLVLDGGGANIGQLWEPFTSISALRPGMEKLQLDRFFDLTWKTHSSLFVTQQMIDQEPKLVRDLVTAFVKAIHELQNNRAKYYSILTKVVGQPAPVLNSALDNSNPRYEMDLTMYYRMAEEMYALKMVRNDVAATMEKSVNYQFLSEITGRTPEQLGYVSYADFKAGKRSSIQ